MENEKKLKCPSCGSEIEANVKFCPYCGTTIGEKNDAPAQPALQQANGQTQDGQPFVYFNVPPQNTVKANTIAATKNSKHTGAFVASLICFFIGLLFVGMYAILYGNMFASSDESVALFFLFLLYLITFGWISIIPAVALHIASLCCAIVCLKSTSKTYKVFGIIIMTLSIISLVAVLASIVLPQMGLWTT